MDKKKIIMNVSAKDRKETEYRFSIVFYVFQEAGHYIAYCPALDLSTSGKTYNESIANFYEMFQLHIECCIEFGTLQEDLAKRVNISSPEGCIPGRLSQV